MGKKIFLAALATLFLSSACALNHPTGEAFSNIPGRGVAEKFNQDSLKKRTLRPGDRLQLFFLYDVTRNATEVYRLDNLDEVTLNIRDREDLSGDYSIVPNGWLTLPLLQPLFARGMTVEEVRGIVTEKYEAIFDSPQIFLGLKRWDVNAQTFINSLAQSNRLGPVYEALVQTDGTVSLPLAGNVSVHGQTIQDLHARLQTKFKDAMPALDFIISLVDNQADLVTVLGEVKSPGAFPVATASISLAEALGLAAGWTVEATITDVFVVQERGEELYVGKYDLKNEILLASRIRLSAGDLVFVPRSVPGDINVLVDQLIRRNIPVNLNFNYSKTVN